MGQIFSSIRRFLGYHATSNYRLRFEQLPNEMQLEVLQRIDDYPTIHNAMCCSKDLYKLVQCNISRMAKHQIDQVFVLFKSISASQTMIRSMAETLYSRLAATQRTAWQRNLSTSQLGAFELALAKSHAQCQSLFITEEELVAEHLSTIASCVQVTGCKIFRMAGNCALAPELLREKLFQQIRYIEFDTIDLMPASNNHGWTALLPALNCRHFEIQYWSNSEEALLLNLPGQDVLAILEHLLRGHFETCNIVMEIMRSAREVFDELCEFIEATHSPIEFEMISETEEELIFKLMPRDAAQRPLKVQLTVRASELIIEWTVSRI